MALLSRFDKGAMMAKVDLKSTFKMVPILASEWELVGVYWQGQYYIDTCLPFGLRSAPSIFNNIASALHWILEKNYGATLLHYLDNFFLVGPSRTTYLPGQPCSGSAREWEFQSPQRSVRVHQPASLSWALFWTPHCSSSDCHQTSCRKFHP